MKTKANAEGTSEVFKEWIRVQAEFIREQSGKGVHVMEQPAPAQPPASEQEDDYEYEEEEEAEEVLDSESLACMTASEVNAFYQGRAKAKGVAEEGWRKRGSKPPGWSSHRRCGQSPRERCFLDALHPLWQARPQGAGLPRCKARAPGQGLLQLR